jgi:hypothetical protein
VRKRQPMRQIDLNTNLGMPKSVMLGAVPLDR